MPNFQQTTDTYGLDRGKDRDHMYRVGVFLELPKMQCACVTLEGTPEPALHIPRWPLEQSEKCKVVCLVKQETPEGARWPRGNDETSKHSQPVTYIGSQPQ